MQLGIVLIDGYEDTPKQFLYIRGPDIEGYGTRTQASSRITKPKRTQ